MRSYNNFNSTLFLNEIRNSTVLSSIFNEHDVEVAWKTFFDEFIQICDRHAPRREFRVKNKPWISKDIIKLMYQRDFLHKKAIKTKDQPIFYQYKNVRNGVTRSIRLLKQKFIYTEINKSSGSGKRMWQSLKHFLPSKKNSTNTPNYDITPDIFNSFFTSIGDRVTSHFNDNILHVPDMPATVHERERCFIFKDISPSFVLKSLQTLPNRKGVDILGFDNILLIIASELIYTHITYLFNLSLNTSVVPKDWKVASVTPIYKGVRDTTDPSNYQPISITTSFTKIFELAFKDTAIISNSQSAYLKGRSTQTALHKIINDISSSVDQGLVSAVCSLDMTKGFDTVSHKLLLYKLRYYGFNENSVSWFRSYLSDRRQVVKYYSKISSNLPISRGVPQGSVLGPLLFILFINDFTAIFSDSSCHMYADDTNLYCHGPSLNYVQEIYKISLMLLKNGYLIISWLSMLINQIFYL